MSMNLNQKEPNNYLISGETPSKKSEQFYDVDKFMKMEFGEVWGTQTHMRRRKIILQRHPEIKELLNPDKPYTIIIAILLVPLALAFTYFAKDQSWPIFLFSVYFVGGTINHTLNVLIHDFTHWAGHTNLTVNKVMAILCNIPMGVPSAMTFGKYHADHHNFFGQEHKDPDLPMYFQAKKSKFVIFKSIFFLSHPIIYALRPIIFMPKKMLPSQIINLIVIICTDLIIYKYWGINALLYLVIGSYLSIGPHPAAMHVIAEHYEFVVGIQTYDYFGIWNFFNLDLGYHIEHHDFPACPWYNLRKIRDKAPQFYQKLPHHTSYWKVASKFLFDKNFNLYNRTLRLNDKKLL